MTEIFGFETGIELSTVTNSTLGSSLSYMVFGLILTAFMCVIIWLIIDYKTYNRKVLIFENDGVGYFHLTGKDKARIIKIGAGGEELLWLKKRKVYRTAYGKKMGKNEYWFVVGQDGYWYNSILGDFDAKMGMLDIEPIDRDMRLFHVAVRKNVEDRYRKIKFMDKYGTFIFSLGLLLVFFVGMYFIVDQIGNLMEQAIGVAQTSQNAIEPMKEALARVDQICSGGSGLEQV
jgi:hypothetical protein